VTVGSQNETWQFDYDTSGRSFHVTYPDGHVREQLYDSEGRLKSRCYKYSGQSFCYTATYDGAGNPLTMTDPYAGTDTFQYDALNRLTQVTRAINGTTEHVETYTYNAIGALKTTFDPGAMTEVTLDDQRPKLSGNGTADAAVVKTLGGQPVTLDGGGRVTSRVARSRRNRGRRWDRRRYWRLAWRHPRRSGRWHHRDPDRTRRNRCNSRRCDRRLWRRSELRRPGGRGNRRSDRRLDPRSSEQRTSPNQAVGEGPWPHAETGGQCD
jgi:YD repeat-containing protein